MYSRLDIRREYTTRAIENKALLGWIWSEEDANDIPILSKSQHVFLSEPHMYGAGCCGWRRYFILNSATRTLAVFSVSRVTSASPQLHRRSTVPSGLVEGKAFSLTAFYEWENQQAKLITERRVQEDAEAKKRAEVTRTESQTSLETILRTAFTAAPQVGASDELDEILDELDGIAA